MQSYRRDEERAPQLTHTDPSRKLYPRQSRAPAEPEQNHTVAGRAAERESAERPAGTSDDSATNDGSPRTTRRTERAEWRGRPEENDARVDEEPLHHEAHRTIARVTTTREPMLGAHATRVVERAGKRDTVAETHFQSNLSHWTYWYVAGLCRTVSHNINTMLLQCAPNLFNLLLIHTTNADAAL